MNLRSHIVALIVSAIFCNVFASALLKHASTGLSGLSSQGIPRSYIYYAGAMLMYVAAFAFYALVLRYLPVSKAYTIITFGAQMGLIILGYVFFGERFGGLAWLGLLLVVLGLVLIGRSAAP